MLHLPPFLTTIFLQPNVATPASLFFFYLFLFFPFSSLKLIGNSVTVTVGTGNLWGLDLVDVVVSAAPALFQLHMPRLVSSRRRQWVCFRILVGWCVSDPGVEGPRGTTAGIRRRKGSGTGRLQAAKRVGHGVVLHARIQPETWVVRGLGFQWRRVPGWAAPRWFGVGRRGWWRRVGGFGSCGFAMKKTEGCEILV